jgi:hypothetical protein
LAETKLERPSVIAPSEPQKGGHEEARTYNGTDPDSSFKHDCKAMQAEPTGTCSTPSPHHEIRRAPIRRGERTPQVLFPVVDLDNAPAESFFATVETELSDRTT